MVQEYIHFTDPVGVEGIRKTNSLWQSSYGPAGAVFAVAVGASWVPNVQLSSMGRAKVRSVAIVFQTDLLPDYAMPEECMWHVGQLPIKKIRVITPAEAKKMLNHSIPEDEKTEMLEIKLHPAFNVLGEWTRMPEDFSPWIPGVDTKKYEEAFYLWRDTKDVAQIKEMWERDKSNNKLKNIIGFYTDDKV